MHFKRPKNNDIEVNITPLIDVVFLLLIFFMVTSSFVKETHLLLQLPTASYTKTTEASASDIEVVVDQSGFYRINGRSLVDNDEETLTSALKNLSEENYSLPITITADASSPYQSIVSLIDIAGEMGFSQINITTQNSIEE